MQDDILIAKVLAGSAKKKEPLIDTPDAEVTRVCNTTNVLLKYNLHLDLMDNETTIDLRLQSVKNYCRHLA